MYIKGMKVTKRNDLGFRSANPLKDINLRGDSVESNYTSFVKINDCTLRYEGNKCYYNAEKAPCIPISHGGTYYGYGMVNIRKSRLGIWIGEDLCHEYQQKTAYFVEKRSVYISTIQKKITSTQTFRDVLSIPSAFEVKSKKLFDKLMNCDVQLTEDSFRIAILNDKYDWFEKHMHNRSEEEQELFESLKLEALLQTNDM